VASAPGPSSSTADRRATNPSTARSRLARASRPGAGGGPLVVGQPGGGRVGRRIGEDVVGEAEDEVSGLGQAGVAHEHEDLQVAAVHEAVDRPRGEPHEGPGLERDLVEA
jgi:hypothetical protein